MRRTSLAMAECGRCRQLHALTMVGAPRRVIDFAALVGIIRHPVEGLVLFDTGYDPAFLAATRPFPERLYRWTTPVTLPAGQTAVERLAAMGHAPDDVRHVVLSHFHGDHVAGLHRFPHARLHCARAGLADLRSRSRLSRTRHGLLAALVPDRIGEAQFFEDAAHVALPSAVAPFDRGADLLGDSSLVAVELPGHCPGHWGLALALDDGRHALLVADAAWSLDAIERDAPPPRFTAGLLGDPVAARATLRALHGLCGRDGLALLPSHCRRASRAAGLLA